MRARDPDYALKIGLRRGKQDPFDSLAQSARSLTVPGLHAKKGRKNRDPLGCPGPGTHLKIPANHVDFAVISIVRVEELRAV